MKSPMKWFGLLFTLLILAGCQTVAGKQNKNPITILMYHHFDENEANTNSVTMTQARFKDQLTALKDAGYTSIRERELYDYYYNDGELPEKPVLITIDDGYMSNFELAYPVLEELGFFATVYAVTDFRGTTPGQLPHFSWDIGREMYESGIIDIQSHTANAHLYVEGEKKEGPFLTTKLKGETDEQYKERIREDLRRSKETIEAEIGNEVYALTYPYGAVNEDVIEIARELGFEMMYTVRKDLNDSKTSQYELYRINADGSFTGDQLIQEIEKY